MKSVTIIINGTEHEVEKEELAFEQVVELAYENPPFGENTGYSITYRRGRGEKPEGILRPGESVKVKEGMVFDVTATDRS